MLVNVHWVHNGRLSSTCNRLFMTISIIHNVYVLFHSQAVLKLAVLSGINDPLLSENILGASHRRHLNIKAFIFIYFIIYFIIVNIAHRFKA